MATKSKENSTALADALANHVPPPRFKTWIDKLPADKRARLEEVKRRYRAGLYADLRGGLSEIYRFCVKAEGLAVGLCQFSRWLKT